MPRPKFKTKKQKIENNITARLPVQAPTIPSMQSLFQPKFDDPMQEMLKERNVPEHIPLLENLYQQIDAYEIGGKYSTDMAFKVLEPLMDVVSGGLRQEIHSRGGALSEERTKELSEDFDIEHIKNETRKIASEMPSSTYDFLRIPMFSDQHLQTILNDNNASKKMEFLTLIGFNSEHSPYKDQEVNMETLRKATDNYLKTLTNFALNTKDFHKMNEKDILSRVKIGVESIFENQIALDIFKNIAEKQYSLDYWHGKLKNESSMSTVEYEKLQDVIQFEEMELEDSIQNFNQNFKADNDGKFTTDKEELWKTLNEKEEILNKKIKENTAVFLIASKENSEIFTAINNAIILVGGIENKKDEIYNFISKNSDIKREDIEKIYKIFNDIVDVRQEDFDKIYKIISESPNIKKEDVEKVKEIIFEIPDIKQKDLDEVNKMFSELTNMRQEEIESFKTNLQAKNMEYFEKKFVEYTMKDNVFTSKHFNQRYRPLKHERDRVEKFKEMVSKKELKANEFQNYAKDKNLQLKLISNEEASAMFMNKKSLTLKEIQKKCEYLHGKMINGEPDERFFAVQEYSKILEEAYQDAALSSHNVLRDIDPDLKKTLYNLDVVKEEQNAKFTENFKQGSQLVGNMIGKDPSELIGRMVLYGVAPGMFLSVLGIPALIFIMLSVLNAGRSKYAEGKSELLEKKQEENLEYNAKIKAQDMERHVFLTAMRAKLPTVAFNLASSMSEQDKVFTPREIIAKMTKGIDPNSSECAGLLADLQEFYTKYPYDKKLEPNSEEALNFKKDFKALLQRNINVFAPGQTIEKIQEIHKSIYAEEKLSKDMNIFITKTPNKDNYNIDLNFFVGNLKEKIDPNYKDLLDKYRQSFLGINIVDGKKVQNLGMQDNINELYTILKNKTPNVNRLKTALEAVRNRGSKNNGMNKIEKEILSELVTTVLSPENSNKIDTEFKKAVLITYALNFIDNDYVKNLVLNCHNEEKRQGLFSLLADDKSFVSTIVDIDAKNDIDINMKNILKAIVGNNEESARAFKNLEPICKNTLERKGFFTGENNTAIKTGQKITVDKITYAETTPLHEVAQAIKKEMGHSPEDIDIFFKEKMNRPDFNYIMTRLNDTTHSIGIEQTNYFKDIISKKRGFFRRDLQNINAQKLENIGVKDKGLNTSYNMELFDKLTENNDFAKIIKAYTGNAMIKELQNAINIQNTINKDITKKNIITSTDSSIRYMENITEENHAKKSIGDPVPLLNIRKYLKGLNINGNEKTMNEINKILEKIEVEDSITQADNFFTFNKKLTFSHLFTDKELLEKLIQKTQEIVDGKDIKDKAILDKFVSAINFAYSIHNNNETVAITINNEQNQNNKPEIEPTQIISPNTHDQKQTAPNEKLSKKQYKENLQQMETYNEGKNKAKLDTIKQIKENIEGSTTIRMDDSERRAFVEHASHILAFMSNVKDLPTGENFDKLNQEHIEKTGASQIFEGFNKELDSVINLLEKNKNDNKDNHEYQEIIKTCHELKENSSSCAKSLSGFGNNVQPTNKGFDIISVKNYLTEIAESTEKLRIIKGENQWIGHFAEKISTLERFGKHIDDMQKRKDFNEMPAIETGIGEVLQFLLNYSKGTKIEKDMEKLTEKERDVNYNAKSKQAPIRNNDHDFTQGGIE